MKDPTHGLFYLPSKEERRISRNGAPLNPFKLAMMLTPMQGAMFFSGWLAWTIDAWDFFSVSLSVTALSEQFGRMPHDITTAITLTLLFRSVGAAIFGYVDTSRRQCLGPLGIVRGLMLGPMLFTDLFLSLQYSV